MFKFIMRLLGLLEALAVAFKTIWKIREEEKLNEELAKKSDDLTNDTLRDLLR